MNTVYITPVYNVLREHMMKIYRVAWSLSVMDAVNIMPVVTC